MSEDEYMSLSNPVSIFSRKIRKPPVDVVKHILVSFIIYRGIVLSAILILTPLFPDYTVLPLIFRSKQVSNYPLTPGWARTNIGCC